MRTPPPIRAGTPVTRPVEMLTNLISKNARLINRDKFDYRLRSGSPAINAGSNPGMAHEFSLIPVSQYVHPRRYEDRAISGPIDIGAYEFVGAELEQNIPSRELSVPQN